MPDKPLVLKQSGIIGELSINGKSKKLLVVKQDESGIDFITPAFTELRDTPISYIGNSGRTMTVNSDETGLQFSEYVSTDERVKVGSSIADTLNEEDFVQSTDNHIQIRNNAITISKLASNIDASTKGLDADKVDHCHVSDTETTTNHLWTSSKIQTELNTKSDTTHLHTFPSLIGVPSSYDGEAGSILRVNMTEDGIDFTSIPNFDFTGLNDVPHSYTDCASKITVVKPTEDGLEFKEILELLPSNILGVENYVEFDATANQTDFELPFEYTIGEHQLMVYLNGLHVRTPSVYLEPSINQISFITPLNLNDRVSIYRVNIINKEPVEDISSIWEKTADFNSPSAVFSEGMKYPATNNCLQLKYLGGEFLDLYTDTTKITDLDNVQCYGGRIALSENISLGTGDDGDVEVNGTVNLSTTSLCGRSYSDMIVYNATYLASTHAIVNNTVSGIMAGDEILLMNVQGDCSSVPNVGNYEFLRVSSVSTNRINFATSKLKYYGSGSTNDVNLGTSGSNQRVIVQRVPNYKNMTINGTLVVNSWNGNTGGVLAFRVKETLLHNGLINVCGAGFRANRENYTGNWDATAQYPDYGNTSMAKLYLGTAGQPNYVASGGNGGGAVYIACKDFECTVSTASNIINASGSGAGEFYSAPSMFRGQSGGGGSVLVKCTNFNVSLSSFCYAYTNWPYGVIGGTGMVVAYYQNLNGNTNSSPACNNHTVEGNFSLTGSYKSINLLQSVVNLDSIDTFRYSLDAIPINTTISLQFSQDAINWYDDYGTLDETIELVRTNGTIYLDRLGWNTANFYYRFNMTSDGDSSPIVNEVELQYLPKSYYPGIQTWISESISIGIPTKINYLKCKWYDDTGDAIQPKFQILGSDSNRFLGEETVYPATNEYYQFNSIYDLPNDEWLIVHHQVASYFYYWKVKVYIDTGLEVFDTPKVYYISVIGASLNRKGTVLRVIDDFSAVSGDELLCDTSLSGFTITLPASPKTGEQIKIVDAAGTFGTNNMIIDPNGNKIMGVSDSLNVDVSNFEFTLMYDNDTNGWRITR